jgi:tryptophan synthase alpha chain
MTGITGANLLLDGTMEILIAHIRKYTANPIAVGFGVSTPDDAATIAKLSDGVIVGSAIIKRLQENPDTLRDYLSDLRRAIA